ncbi:phosphate-regulating neutral endopeptidase PHEX [Drosophila willistoni]|nr:phosphate-regulating neutral endopeptidase PHEX [Drosophila willistoni]
MGINEMDINRLTALEIHKNLNATISPCSNFWSYACGSFSQHSKYIDNFQRVEFKYAQKMEEFFEANNLKDFEIEAPYLVGQMRSYYKACVNAPKMNYQPTELMNILTPTTNSWEWYVAKLRKYGLNDVFLHEQVDVAYNDSSKQIIQLKMSEANTFNPRLLLELGKDAEERQTIMNLLNATRNLEEKCYEDRDTYSWSLEELIKEIPQINWQIYFQELLDLKETDLKRFNLRFEVSQLECLKELGNLLKTKSLDTILPYLRLRLMMHLRKYQANLNCVHHMRALLPLGMTYIYNKYIYQNRIEDTQKMEEIFAILRGTFSKYVEANRLQLKSEELTYVRDKLNAMKLKLGNLPEEKSSEYYNEHYRRANFSDFDFIKNLEQALALRTYLQHAPLLVNESRLQLYQYYVNDDVTKARTSPYYENERNTLIVPLIFLQWPLFDHRQHPIFVQSLMGFILGHELSHAFEQEGILYDSLGNESPMGWQIRQSELFQNSLQCAAGTPFASLKERLADLNGLQLAYDSFFGLHHDSQLFEYRPYEFESEFLAPQLFYLSFAQFFCGSLPPVLGHDMDDVRVNVSVKNIQQFAKDFKCPLQKKHHEQEQQQQQLNYCQMWRPSQV